ncbi:MAG TPA: biosynthetic arginine decarboxylase, partial [Candidatus Polarisedimenticolaceae bacterium]|nr:biosynthetic arginine decarboxylase [Candidatus Polarisedimenticolaceae bacterium]
IKVNQQRRVVEEMVRFGAEDSIGLEAGSKPELLIALAQLDTPGALIICNGYKDRAYVETALLAQRLGRTPIIVIDRYHELDLVLKTASELGIRPHIGLRARLTTKGAGKWVESTGDRSKFGLSAEEIVDAVERLRAEDMLDCLELLHFHIGSQITAIRAHKDALREASRIFAGLHEMGARPTIVDVGGGLGVDYDGSQTNFHSSMNYTVEEYANDVVAALQEAADEKGIPHPDIVTESGRAMVAHHSVLVFDVLGVNEMAMGKAPEPAGEDEPKVVRDLGEVLGSVRRKNVLESYHDALQLKEEAATLFSLGYLDLRGRARVERMFWACCEKILRIARDMETVPEELGDLERGLADTYYGNFSVFQSAPDHWAVDQLFPVMPIQRLAEEPTEQAVLADLTCDSDGRLDRFIDARGTQRSIRLHPVLTDEPYYIGIFLVGAYQEILGDLHNLFGDTNAVHVNLDDDGNPTISQIVRGDTMQEVLEYVQFNTSDLFERLRLAADAALLNGRMSARDVRKLESRYREAMGSYTYLIREDEAF